ncbi:UBX domain protein 6 L homeolog isoform X1 [Xenopus laevis]|uniref:UBX domain-containing protein 6 n=1 Tax=Xenopus laevis TaxID=8355 RepID=A0A8J0VDA9_XENLA|nr:UBX domain protein 6 L homeolog isoform X1 [Xenopus laevis]
MKKFFDGLKSDIKFKSVGPGHKLNEDNRENVPKVTKEQAKPRRPPTGEAQIAAASAAMARMESMQGRPKGQFKDTVGRKEVIVEQKEEAIAAQKDIDTARKKSSSICTILFRCPLTDELLRKEEREGHIRNVIQGLSNTDPTSAAILKIHTYNKDREKVKFGTETIAKYLNNIISHPEEEKYYKIKLSNKVFQEKISCLEGSHEFFEAIGFEKRTIHGQDLQEDFFVLGSDAMKNLDALQGHCDALLSAEPLRVSLERQLRIFMPSIEAAHFDLTSDFFNLTAEEIKKEQRDRTERMERNAMLRTKAMREREEQREMKKYNYTVLRIKLPDGYILQGIFFARERISALFDFVREQLQDDWLPYELLAPGGHKVKDEQATLIECGLVPSALLTFRWDAAVMADVEAGGGHGSVSVIKPELLSKVEQLT